MSILAINRRPIWISNKILEGIQWTFKVHITMITKLRIRKVIVFQCLDPIPKYPMNRNVTLYITLMKIGETRLQVTPAHVRHIDPVVTWWRDSDSSCSVYPPGLNSLPVHWHYTRETLQYLKPSNIVILLLYKCIWLIVSCLCSCWTSCWHEITDMLFCKKNNVLLTWPFF